MPLDQLTMTVAAMVRINFTDFNIEVLDIFINYFVGRYLDHRCESDPANQNRSDSDTVSSVVSDGLIADERRPPSSDAARRRRFDVA